MRYLNPAALAIGAAPGRRRPSPLGYLHPAPLHHQLGLAVLLACGKPSQNIANTQGCGHVADIIRVWGWACVVLQRGWGLVCIIKTSFQEASQPMKHCFLEGIGGMQARLIFAHFGTKRCQVWWRRWVLALQNAVTTAKNCCAERWAVVLSVLLLLWLARVLRGPCFFLLVFGPFCARARPQPQNAAIYGDLLHVHFQAGLRAVLFGLLFLGHPGLGPGRAQKAGIPGIIWGWGGQHA